MRILAKTVLSFCLRRSFPTCLATFSIFLVFVKGDILKEHPHNDGYSTARLLNLRVLHKGSIPVHETYRPDIIGRHLKELSIEVNLDSKSIWVDLHLNTELLTENYFEMYQKDGVDVVQRHTAQTTDVCHYKGKIRGRPKSWAAISTCDGIRGVIFDGKHTHHLEPHRLSDGSYSRNGLWTVNLVYPYDGAQSTSGLKKNRNNYKGEEINSLLGANEQTASRVKRDAKTEALEPYNSNNNTRYVEMVIVVDNKKFKELGGDMRKTVQRTKDVCNIVTALYAPLNIFVALVGVVVWNEMDQIQLTPNGDETLANFLRYRRERLGDHPNDNAQLLTAIEFEKGVVGKAMQGPMCSYQFSGGVNSDHKSLPGVVATTIAHELGHNFGLAHDDETCKCDGPGGRCIMSASSSSNRTSHWSSCSLKNFTEVFQHGMDYCLRNIPKRLFHGPVCGNGFTEPGEECDCGIADFCTNPCCNAETCTLHKNATCGAGPCCDLETCHVKPGGTVCRPASNVCDLPEFCTGEGEHCPSDVYKLNGEQCETSNGQAYCYEGKCRTHTDQCRLLWGPSGNSSSNLCYQKNINASRIGNCGFNLVNKTYKACKVEDTKCGLLHCKYYHEKLEFGYEPVAILSNFFVHFQNDVHACRSVTVDFGTRDVDPGLVPDGAKCGTDKMCVSQKCVPVTSVMGNLKCVDGCGKNGVCNSNGHCHCDDGYGGYTCSSSGYGGSVDSGPSIDPYAVSMFAKALYVTFVGFIPLIAIISFYIYYADDNWKEICIYARALRRQRQGGPKPDGGSSARAIPNSDTSSSLSGSSGNNNSKTVVPDDFFGTHKGFTLAPIQKSDAPTSNNTTPSSPSSSDVSPVNNNKGAEVLRNGFCNSGSANIQSSTNSNVYYSPVPTQTVNELLVKNRNNERPSLKSYTNNLLQKGMARVSWAQPVAQPLPTNSPTSEDESSTGIGYNIYENTQSIHCEVSSNTGAAANGSTATTNQRQPVQSRIPSLLPTADGKPVEKSTTAAPASRFSRIAGAFPFMRNSIRNFGSSDDATKIISSNSNKNCPNRKNLEISMPILQSECSNEVPPSPKSRGVVSAAVLKFEDEKDGSKNPGSIKSGGPVAGRYCNVPLIDESPSKETYCVDTSRLPNVTSGVGASKTVERKPVLRAHSMIQPSRNSVHNPNNPNFNSLRRNRPSMPPPKPPEAPPPPPPVTYNNPPAPVKARSESPPATKPKSSLRPVINTGNISSILKMSLSRNNSRSQASPPLRPEPPHTGNINRNTESKTSMATSGPQTQDKQNDNIYDEIAETKKDVKKVEEKVETLSTGSSESTGGLLSEIILEIQQRNKESIYNSVDRRKKKREAAALNGDRDRPKLSYQQNNRANDSTKPGSNKSSPKASPKSSPKMSPKFKYKPMIPSYPVNKLKPTDVPSIASVMNNSQAPTVTNNRSRSNSPLLSTPTPSAYKPIAPPLPAANPVSNSAPPIGRPSSPPVTSGIKPMCAVNGIPKIASSPSYVAKINYFSNLGTNKPDSPMKPLNSLNSTLGEGNKSLVSDIYSSSNVSVPEPTHLSTIRPTYARPYISNKSSGSSLDGSDGSRLNNSSSSTTGEYGTLGRNRSKKVEVEKQEAKSSPPKEETQQGYKPFNPYLNRPLTFSTFRPQSSPTSSTSSTSSTTAPTTVTPPKSSPKPIEILPKTSTAASLSTSLYTKPTLVMDTAKNSVRPPLTMGISRSPARVAQ